MVLALDKYSDLFPPSKPIRNYVTKITTTHSGEMNDYKIVAGCLKVYKIDSITQFECSVPAHCTNVLRRDISTSIFSKWLVVCYSAEEIRHQGTYTVGYLKFERDVRKIETIHSELFKLAIIRSNGRETYSFVPNVLVYTGHTVDVDVVTLSYHTSTHFCLMDGYEN